MKFISNEQKKKNKHKTSTIKNKSPLVDHFFSDKKNKIMLTLMDLGESKLKKNISKLFRKYEEQANINSAFSSLLNQKKFLFFISESLKNSSNIANNTNLNFFLSLMSNREFFTYLSRWYTFKQTDKLDRPYMQNPVFFIFISAFTSVPNTLNFSNREDRSLFISLVDNIFKSNDFFDISDLKFPNGFFNDTKQINTFFYLYTNIFFVNFLLNSSFSLDKTDFQELISNKNFLKNNQDINIFLDAYLKIVADRDINILHDFVSIFSNPVFKKQDDAWKLIDIIFSNAGEGVYPDLIEKLSIFLNILINPQTKLFFPEKSTWKAIFNSIKKDEYAFLLITTEFLDPVSRSIKSDKLPFFQKQPEFGKAIINKVLSRKSIDPKIISYLFSLFSNKNILPHFFIDKRNRDNFLFFSENISKPMIIISDLFLDLFSSLFLENQDPLFYLFSNPNFPNVFFQSKQNVLDLIIIFEKVEKIISDLGLRKNMIFPHGSNSESIKLNFLADKFFIIINKLFSDPNFFNSNNLHLIREIIENTDNFMFVSLFYFSNIYFNPKLPENFLKNKYQEILSLFITLKQKDIAFTYFTFLSNIFSSPKLFENNNWNDLRNAINGKSDDELIDIFLSFN